MQTCVLGIQFHLPGLTVPPFISAGHNTNFACSIFPAPFLSCSAFLWCCGVWCPLKLTNERFPYLHFTVMRADSVRVLILSSMGKSALAIRYCALLIKQITGRAWCRQYCIDHHLTKKLSAPLFLCTVDIRRGKILQERRWQSFSHNTNRRNCLLYVV